MRRHLLALAFAAVFVLGAVSGCLNQAGQKDAGSAKKRDGVSPSAAGEALRLRPQAVIADIDTGINPYHVDFRDANRTVPPSEYIPGYPANSTAINLTLDAPDYKTAFAADLPQWDALKMGQLVWFPGTKIIGAIAVAGKDGKYPVLDENSHGSGTSSVVLEACPQCSILMIDFTSSSAAQALEWVAKQPWIDAVTMSWGLTSGRGTASDPSPALNTAIQHVWPSGKLLVAAAGNTPYPYSWYLPAGSPLVIAVGGSEHSTHGETTVASKFPDVVSNYTNRVAHKETFTSVGPGQGTSFASPSVAGVIGRMLLALRGAPGASPGSTGGILVQGPSGGPGLLSDGKVTNSELWAALNQSAEYFSTADYRPQDYKPFDPLWIAAGFTLPILPAPFVQMGWGWQGPETVQRAVNQVLGKPVPVDPMKTAAAPYMAQKDTVEHRLWG